MAIGSHVPSFFCLKLKERGIFSGSFNSTKERICASQTCGAKYDTTLASQEDIMDRDMTLNDRSRTNPLLAFSLIYQTKFPYLSTPLHDRSRS